MTDRIYTAAEALALSTTPGVCGECSWPWPHSANSCRCGASIVAFVGAPVIGDLAASVAFHARRAERAEAELIEAHDRARDAEAERAAAEAAITAVWQAVTDDDLPRLPGGDGLVVDAEAVGQRVAAAMAERDALRAIVAGRTTPPTDAEIEAHASAGGTWLVDDGCGVYQKESRRAVIDARADGDVVRWLPLNTARRPCVWPTTEAPDAR